MVKSVAARYRGLSLPNDQNQPGTSSRGPAFFVGSLFEQCEVHKIYCVRRILLGPLFMFQSDRFSQPSKLRSHLPSQYYATHWVGICRPFLSAYASYPKITMCTSDGPPLLHVEIQHSHSDLQRHPAYSPWRLHMRWRKSLFAFVSRSLPTASYIGNGSFCLIHEYCGLPCSTCAIRLNSTKKLETTKYSWGTQSAINTVPKPRKPKYPV